MRSADGPGSGLTRQQFLKAGGATLAGAAALGGLAGCGAAGTSGGGSAGGGGGGGRSTLVVAVPALLSSLDREFEVGAGSMEAMNNVYDAATMWATEPFGSTGSRVPQLGDTKRWRLNLIEEASVARDGLTWTIRFKPGIASHAGNELGADDFLYTLQRHQGVWVLGAFYNHVAGFLPRWRADMFKTLDRHTIRVRTQKPSPLFLQMLENNFAMGLFDGVEARRHATGGDKWSTGWMKSNGDKAGHGPYTIESHKPGTETVFRAFADYHGGKPAIDTVIHRAIESSSTRASLLTAGQVDVVRDLLPAEFKKLEQTRGVVVDDFDKAKFLLLMLVFNTTRRPFDDPRVRQALAWAAPYDAIVDNVYQGYADRWNGVISRDYPFFDEGAWPYGDGRDFERARALLKQAGYGSGLTVNVIYNASEPQPELAAIELQSAFKEIGVDLKLQKYAAAAFTEKLTATQFDAAVWLDLSLTPDIGYCCYLYFQSRAFANMGKYRDARADALIEQILTTLDEEKRAEVARSFQRYVLQQSPHLYLAQPHYMVARRENVKGVTAYTSRTLRFDDVTKA